MKQRLSRVLFLVFFCQWIFAAFLFAAGTKEPVGVTANVDKKSVFIGDKIKYTIQLKAPADTKIEFSHFAENLGGFAVRDYKGSRKKRFFKKEIMYKQEYILDTYTTGKYEIPPAKIKYKTAAGKECVISTEKLAVEVKSILMIDGKTPADIKDIKSVLNFAKNWKLWLLGGLFIILGIGGVSLYLLKKKRGLKNIIPQPTAHEIAYKALDELENSGLLGRGLIKEYFFRLSFIVRQYIENRFNLRAPEMTTEEFLTATKESSAISSSIKNLLRDFLQKADMVKFAKYGPTQIEIKSAFDSAKNLVGQTKQETANEIS